MDYDSATQPQRELIKRRIHWMLGKEWHEAVERTSDHERLNRADASTLIHYLTIYDTSQRGVTDREIQDAAYAESMIHFIVNQYVSTT